MNQPSQNDLIKTLRDKFADYLNKNWSSDVPILWQNMPAPDSMPEQGWIHFSCHLDRLRPLGLSRQHRLAQGRLRITIAISKGVGMAASDQTTDQVIKVFSVASIDNIRIGSITMDRPRDDKSHHIVGLNIGFDTISST